MPMVRVSNGGTIAKGEYTTSTSASTKITTGFKPSIVVTIQYHANGSLSSGVGGFGMYYDEQIFGSSNIVRVAGTAGNNTKLYSFSELTANGIASIDTDGFTILKSTSVDNGYYIAIK